MRLHTLQYINYYLQFDRKMLNLRINRICTQKAPKVLLLLSQYAPWTHIPVCICWNQKYNMLSHRIFLCLEIHKSGRKKWKQWRVTLLQNNVIKLALHVILFNYHYYLYLFFTFTVQFLLPLRNFCFMSSASWQ